MKKTDALLWHVYADGELIAAVRYAIDAARMALQHGPGARVEHTGRVVLSVSERLTTWEAADEAAKAMISLAYPDP